MEYTKKNLILVSVISVSIIITTICVLTIVGSQSYLESYFEENNTDLINFPQALIVQRNGCNFTALDLTNQNFPVQLNLNATDTKNCNFDMFTSKILFYNEDFSTIKSTSTNYSDIILPSNYEISTKFDETIGYELAVDVINKKIYAISLNNKFESDKLIVTDFQGKYYRILLSNLNMPKYLVLDSQAGFLFIGQQSMIIRVTMDGTDVKKIVEKHSITELAIDRNNDRIYWANLITIESSNYDGNERRNVISIPSFITSLTILGNQLFWISHNSIITTCNINSSGICGSFSTIPFDEPKRIKAYNFNQLQVLRESTRNQECELNVYDCEHLCLLNKRSSRCVCNLGYKYNSYGTCELSNNEFLLYIQGSYFKSYTTDFFELTHHFTNVIHPIRFTTASLKRKNILSFDYDFNENYVFFADDFLLYGKKLKLGEKQININSKIDNVYFISIATDWVSKIIYCTVVEVDLTINHYSIRAYSYYSLKNRFGRYKTIWQSVDENLKIYDIVVHPNRGQIFFVVENTKDSPKSQIYQMNSDGTDLHVFREEDWVRNFAIAIDFGTDKIYWFFNQSDKYIGQFNGHADNIIFIADLNNISDYSYFKINYEIVKDPITINVFENTLFISNGASIWPIDKYGFTYMKQVVDLTKIGSTEAIAGSKIFSRKAQPFVDGHPCAINNGGCQIFCFALPTSERKLQRQCACDDLTTLQIDQKSCA